MRQRQEWRSALAALGAAAGVGYGSGREFALFFAQLGSAAWFGMAAASALFGLLVALLCRRAQRCEAWPGASGDAVGRAAEVLRGLMAALTTAMMLSRAGHLGALTLPLRHAWGFGMAFALVAALLLRTCGASVRGLAVLLPTALFYAALALDARQVRVFEGSETELRLAGSMGWAMALAVMYAAMCACTAAWVVTAVGAARSAGAGIRAGGLLLGMLALQKLALTRGGTALMAQPMPWVLLSARWGLAGFWCCAAVVGLCAVSTLSAALGALLALWRRGGTARTLAGFMLGVGALVCLVLTLARG